MKPPRLVSLIFLVLTSTAAQARVGFGDPAQEFRDHKPGEVLDIRGYLRVRGAGYSNLDLDHRVSPSTGEGIWARGEGPLNLTNGADMRVRLSPSLWLGEDVRMLLEVDVLDNVTLGSVPKGTPYNGRTGMVAGTAFQEPITAATGAFRVRTAMGQAITPLGIISAGRSPSHFGLGIAANSGDDLDDDGGDRADRVAWMLPFLGHFLAASADLSSSGPRGNTQTYGPNPISPALTQQALSFAILRWRAPWEVDMHRAGDWRSGWVLDYGAAFSTQFQLADNPVFYQALSGGAGLPKNQQVTRNYFAALGDFWLRLWWKDFRLETEIVASYVHIGNASPYPGVELRKPVNGNPLGGVVVGEWLPLKGKFGLLAEAGIASADPAPGFPQSDASAFVGSQAGDAFGPQVNGSSDTRFDSFRFHPSYRVDLIMWRTLLGGVSEAAYGRMKFSTTPVQGVKAEIGGIYSQGLISRSTPGGVAPLGAEVDSAVTLAMGAFSARVDAGVLLPLGGLGQRGAHAPHIAQMVLVRLGYVR
jgi:uncharacterized protein (TIGR04551 family)